MSTFDINRKEPVLSPRKAELPLHFVPGSRLMGAWGKTGVPKHVSAAPAPSPFPVPTLAAAPSSAPSPAPAPAPAPKQGAKSKNCCLAQLLNTLAITDPTTKQPHSACPFGASCRFLYDIFGWTS